MSEWPPIGRKFWLLREILATPAPNSQPFSSLTPSPQKKEEEKKEVEKNFRLLRRLIFNLFQASHPAQIEMELESIDVKSNTTVNVDRFRFSVQNHLTKKKQKRVQKN